VHLAVVALLLALVSEMLSMTEMVDLRSCRDMEGGSDGRWLDVAAMPSSVSYH